GVRKRPIDRRGEAAERFLPGLVAEHTSTRIDEYLRIRTLVFGLRQMRQYRTIELPQPVDRRRAHPELGTDQLGRSECLRLGTRDQAQRRERAKAAGEAVRLH